VVDIAALKLIVVYFPIYAMWTEKQVKLSLTWTFAYWNVSYTPWKVG